MFRCRILMGLSIAGLALAGCSRPGDAPAPATPSSVNPAPTSELSSGPVEEAPAESSLAIKRGMVTGEGDHATFRACDDPTELWLIDGEGTLTQLLTEDTTSLYVESYGERGPLHDDPTATRDYAGDFMLEQLLYAASTAEGRGCDRPLPDNVVSARGNEPFWAVEVTQTGMLWKQPDDPKEIALGDLQAEDAEGTVGYRASDAGHQLELQIEAQACRDSMSGEYFAFAARAVLDGREFKGCARVGTQDAP